MWSSHEELRLFGMAGGIGLALFGMSRRTHSAHSVKKLTVQVVEPRVTAQRII